MEREETPGYASAVSPFDIYSIIFSDPEKLSVDTDIYRKLPGTRICMWI